MPINLEGKGYVKIFCLLNSTNKSVGPTGNGEDANCLKILQHQSEPISRTNKLFISSSTPEFQENCITNCSSRTSRKQNILKVIKNSTVASVVFLINMSFIHFDYVSTSSPFVQERYCKNWTRLHTSAKIFSEK